MARSLCAGAWLRKPHYLQVGRPRPRHAPSSVPLRPASRSSPPPSPGAAPALPPSESRLGSLYVLHLCSWGGPQPCHPRLRVSGSKTWCVIPPYFRESCVTSGYASGSPSPRQRLRLGAEPLGLLFSPLRRFKWEGGRGRQAGSRRWVFALVNGKGIVTAVRLALQSAPRPCERGSQSRRVCCWRVNFSWFFLFRCPPSLEPYCCLRALFGHQGDLVDVVSS